MPIGGGPGNLDWLNRVADLFSVPGTSADEATQHPGDYLQQLLGKGAAEATRAFQETPDYVQNATYAMNPLLWAGKELARRYGAEPTVAQMYDQEKPAVGGTEAAISPTTTEDAWRAGQKFEEQKAALREPTMIREAARGAGEFAGDPTNLAILAASAVEPAMAPMISRAFTAQMGSGAIKSGTEGKWGQAALEAAMALAAGKHGFTGENIPGRTLTHGVPETLEGRLTMDVPRQVEMPKASGLRAAGAKPFTPEWLAQEMKKIQEAPPTETDLWAKQVPGSFERPEAWKARIEPDPGKEWTPIKKVEPGGTGIITLKQQQGRSGNYYTYEVAGIPGKVEAERIAGDPKANQALLDYLDRMKQLEVSGHNELLGDIQRNTELIDTLGNVPGVQLVQGEGKLRGIVFDPDAESYAHTWGLAERGMTGFVEPGNNAYFMNPLMTAEHINANLENLLDLKKVTDSQLDALDTFDLETPQYRKYVREVRSGAPRDYAYEERLKAQSFMQFSEYNALHEAQGHAPFDSSHKGSYGHFIYGPDGDWVYSNPMKTFELQDATTEIVVSGDGKIRTPTGNQFEAAHNAIVTALKDPNKLKVYKAFNETPAGVDFQNRVWKAVNRTSSPESLMELQKVGPRLEAKDIGLAQKAADQEFALPETQELVGRGEPLYAKKKQPSTPTAAAPPEYQGPQLEPLTKRIRDAFREQVKANLDNEAKNKAALNLKFTKLGELQEQLRTGQISKDTYLEQSAMIKSGQHNLTLEVSKMPLTMEEQNAIVQRMLTEDAADRIVNDRVVMNLERLKNGERLEPAELDQLKKKFRGGIADADQELKGWFERFAATGENFIGGMRATMSSGDLSAMGRQGLFGTVMNPKEAALAFKDQLKAFMMTKKDFETFMGQLKDPRHNLFADLYDAVGLHLSETGGTIERGQEGFVSGGWAERNVPLVRRTEQAYIAYLNKLRVEIFNKGARQLMANGVEIAGTEGGISQPYHDLAYMANTLTGRGELAWTHTSPGSRLGNLMGLKGGLRVADKATIPMLNRALSSVFFAPRFAASRYAILRDTLVAFQNLDPKVSRMYMKNVVGTVGVMTAIGKAAALATGGTFEWDPRRKDFGVVRVGNTRYDLYGGLKPFAKVIAQMSVDKYEVKGGKALVPYGGMKNRKDILFKFGEGKLSPAAGLLLAIVTGEDYSGLKLRTGGPKAAALKHAQTVLGHSVPMILQTIWDLWKEDEMEQAAVAVPAATLGLGVSVYDEKKPG